MSKADPGHGFEVNKVADATEHQALLFAIAYRMLGSVADAEDIVQETLLRWHRHVTEESAAAVQSPKAWLSTVVTRLCIDQLRSARVQRETYVGPWLPEPLIVDREPDVADSAVLAESLSMAFLVLLESLNPVERAVFLLHDVFGYEYDDIAGVVGRSVVHCRQIARRARAHVADRRPRFEPSPTQHERLTAQFMSACAGGDLPALTAILAEDVTVWSDGGGKAQAARRPIVGRDNVARLLVGILRKAPSTLVSRSARINGQPGIVVTVNGQPLGVVTLEIAESHVQSIRIIVNPDKLRFVSAGMASAARTRVGCGELPR